MEGKIVLSKLQESALGQCLPKVRRLSGAEGTKDARTGETIRDLESVRYIQMFDNVTGSVMVTHLVMTVCVSIVYHLDGPPFRQVPFDLLRVQKAPLIAVETDPIYCEVCSSCFRFDS